MTKLRIRDVTVRYDAGSATVHAVNGVSFDLGAGETLGIIGESGSGKSTFAHALLRLLPRTARMYAECLEFDDQDLQSMSEGDFRRMRWSKIAYIPQGAMNSLVPVQTIGAQFAQIARAHAVVEPRQLRKTAERLFARVGLDPKWLDFYPHEFSGGMRQRAIIAMALLFKPSLVIADEPTTGLDVLVQRQVLDLVKEVQREIGTAMIFVSHDIAVVSEVATHVAVMYAGEIVEIGPVEQVLGRPQHPYTMGLMEAFPDIRDPSKRLVSIEGAGPKLLEPSSRCCFIGRCPFVQERCEIKPAPEDHEGRRTACHFVGASEQMRLAARSPETWRRRAT